MKLKNIATRWTIRHGLMLLWFADLMSVTEEVSLVPSSGVMITPDEGTRQECRDIGYMNCNFFGYIH